MRRTNHQRRIGVVRAVCVGLVCVALAATGALVSAGPWDKPAGDSGAPPPSAQAKILLIGCQPDHPQPGTHLYLQECERLAKCLRQTAKVETVVSDGWPKDPEVFTDIAGIVLYSSPGAEILLQGEHRQQFEALMKRGVGLVALHWATGVRDKDNQELAERYLSHMGGLFSFAFSGLDVSESRVEQIDAAHPICRGWKDFDLKDEYYLDLKFLPEAKPLLRVQVKGKPQTVAWTYERPDAQGGRSYGNTLGHFHELFEQEPFRRMLVNGILWAARVDVPPEGAPCKL